MLISPGLQLAQRRTLAQGSIVLDVHAQGLQPREGPQEGWEVGHLSEEQHQSLHSTQLVMTPAREQCSPVEGKLGWEPDKC